VPLLSKLAAIFRSPASSPPELSLALYPEASSDIALLSKLMADPALQSTLEALGVRAPDLQLHLVAHVNRHPAESKAALIRIRAGALAASTGAFGSVETHRLPQEDLLAFLVTCGTDEVRQLIAGAGVVPASIAFWLAHRSHEGVLRAGWPTSSAACSRVAVVNDPYSPMEAVHRCLVEAFDLSDDKAIQLMLRIHNEGAVHLDLPDNLAAVPFCDEWNGKWRSAGLPLYVHPIEV
jgi:hypothetical protein